MKFRGLLLATIGVVIAPSAFAACINPQGTRGALAYNDTYSVLQLCDGNNWAMVGSGPNTLVALTDVDVSAAADGNVLAYNSTTSKWEAVAPGAGGITALTGDVTASGSGSVAATIANNAVTSIKIFDGTIVNADIANSTIANAKLANVAANTVKGNNTGSAAAPIDLTMTQLRSMIGSGTPGSGNFLRGDGSWQAVSTGTVTGTGAANHIAYWDSASGLSYDSGQLVWDAAANRLGIGTATPAGKLDINGGALLRSDGAAAADGTVIFAHGTTAYQGGLFLTNSTSFASGDASSYAFKLSASYTGTPTNASLRIGLVAGNAPNTYIYDLLSSFNGNVGIGTLTPQSKLHVVGGVQLGNDTDNCPGTSNVKVGTLRYASNVLSVCNAGGWTALASGTGITALTGEVTASGTGSVTATISANAVTTTKIANSNVTYAKIQNVSATNRLLGRATAGAGIVEELTIGSGISLSGTTLSAVGDGAGMTSLTGDVTGSGSGAVATTIANNSVTSAKILDGTIAAVDVANSAVTNAKLANMATMTIKGNNTGAAAAPLDLTTTQLRTMLGTGTPGSGNFLRGDGTWAAPPSGADNLGNHTATTTLALGANALTSSAGTVIDGNGGWHRTYGSTGWYNGTYAGGWYMTDATYIRNYGSKQVSLDANITAPQFLYSSDERLKTEIVTLPDALDRLSQIRGISFRFKEGDGKPHLGVVAQDVQKVYPQAVTADEKGFLRVDYPSLVGPLIEAVRELKADNDNFRRIIEEQGRTIEAQGRAIDTLRHAEGGAH